MIQLRKILVPTDFSEHSVNALRYGLELAAKFGAELHVVHAVEPLVYGEGAYLPSNPDTQEELQAAISKQIADLQLPASDEVEVVKLVTEGYAFVEIVRYSKENNIDLIVQGTHGRGAIAHMLLGSVAEKVVRKSPCPVLSVRKDEHEFVLP